MVRNVCGYTSVPVTFIHSLSDTPYDVGCSVIKVSHA